MKNKIFGPAYQVNSLVETLFQQVAVFENNGEQYYAFSLEQVDETSVILTYDDEPLTSNAKSLLATSLYYRFQDSELTGELKLDHPLEQPMDNHFRILVQVNDYEKYAEEYFIFNAIPQENFAALYYPLSISMGVHKVELIAINVSEEKLSLLSKQAKTQVVAKKVNQKIAKISNTMTASTKIVMSDVVNPLAVATTKVGATIAAGTAKTLVDCAFTAVAEIAKDASSFSLGELKQRDDVNTIKYCVRKMLNKGQEEKKVSGNNFSF